MKKQETNIKLEETLLIRRRAIKIVEEIEEINKLRQKLTLELLNLQYNCNHNIVVRFKNNEIGYEARCLCCNKAFYGRCVGVDFYFQNIIDMQELETVEDKFTLALSLFEREKTVNPNLNDKQIVEIINNNIKENKVFTEQAGFVKTIGKKQN